MLLFEAAFYYRQVLVLMSYIRTSGLVFIFEYSQVDTKLKQLFMNSTQIFDIVDQLDTLIRSESWKCVVSYVHP